MIDDVVVDCRLLLMMLMLLMMMLVLHAFRLVVHSAPTSHTNPKRSFMPMLVRWLYKPIEPSLVDEVATEAGFIIEAKSDLLANTGDDHTLRVFDPTLRGDTDRFVLRLRKPE